MVWDVEGEEDGPGPYGAGLAAALGRTAFLPRLQGPLVFGRAPALRSPPAPPPPHSLPVTPRQQSAETHAQSGANQGRPPLLSHRRHFYWFVRSAGATSEA